MFQFKQLIDQYNYFLLDAYGVFWGSSEVGMLPGALETMAYLVSRGKKVGILSNSTQVASKEKEKYAKHGLKEGVHYHFILTSGEVTRKLLMMEKLPFETPKKTYWLFGSDHPRFSSHSILFQGTNYHQKEKIEEADFIYIAVPHIDGTDQESPENFFKEIDKIRGKNIPVLCANPDRFAHEGMPPRLVVRQGTIAQLLEERGAPVYFVGKPFPDVYKEALKLFPGDVLPKEILMIGDTPETDIRGARQMGIASALVTKTGIMKCRIGEGRASFVISQLPPSDQPLYAIENFGIHGF